MDFGNALNAMRCGHRVRREGQGDLWMKIEEVGEDQREVIVRHTKSGMEDWVTIDPDDLLASDWEIVD